jgi:O-antigen/teichoic acid export membrane protein
MTSILKTAGILTTTFIMSPIILRLIGDKDFGTFKVLTEIYSYLGLVEMGLLASIVSCIIPLLKKEKRDVLEDLLAEGSRKFWKISFWTIIFGLALFPFLKKLTSWSGNSESDLYITFGLLLSTSFLIPSNIYRGYFDASNRGHLLHFINFIQSLFFTFIAVIFAYWGWRIKSQGIAFFLSVAIGAFLLRYFSDIKISLKKKNTQFDNQIASNRKPQVLNELAGKLCLNADQLIIAIFLGPVMVTKVFLGQRVVQIMQLQILSLGQASWASLGSLYYNKETNEGLFEKRLMEMTKVLAIFAVAGLVPICVLNQAFIELWVGEKYLMGSNALVYFASANAFFLGLFNFWGFIFSILGKPGVITKLFWKQAIINVIASIICTKYLGGIGPIVGTLISYLLVPLWLYPKLLKKHFGLHELKLFSSFTWPALVGISSLVFYHFSPWRFNHLTWFHFVFSGIAIFILNSLILFFILFNREEKILFINRILALKKNWKK